METIQVTLIGGPADLQRHVIDSRRTSYEVAEIPSPICREFVDDGTDPMRLLCTTHTYRIRQVDYGVFVGIWQNPNGSR